MANGVPLLTAMVHLSDGELTLLAMNVSKLVFITFFFLSKEHITIFIECQGRHLFSIHECLDKCLSCDLGTQSQAKS